MKLGNSFQQAFFTGLPGVQAGVPTASQNFRSNFPAPNRTSYKPSSFSYGYGGFNPLFMMMQFMMQQLIKLLLEHQKPADPPVEDPPVDDPPVEDPPVEDPPVDDPPVEDPPVEDPPVDDPPVDDPPVDDPPVSGDFPPGSLAQDEVPVDANGNITSEFLEDMLTPTNTVDTNLFDSSEPSGLTKFARVGIRMLGHDLYDGQIDGDVALKSLLNPDESGNSPFVTTPEGIDMVKEWGRRDLNDDGKINGSVYGKLIEDVWPTTDDANIAGFANNLQFKNASLKVSDLFKGSPRVETPEGIAEFVQKTGIPATDLLNFSLWGHRILDLSKSTQQVVEDAVSNPQSLDFVLANFNNDTKAMVQDLIDDANAKSTIGIGVLNFMNRQL